MCKNQTHLVRAVRHVIDNSGEGIILRKRDSKYEHGRNPNLVKLKVALGDKEAIVVGKSDDNSLTLKLPQGKIFSVPPQALLIASPEIGDVVTFYYEANARRDLPVNPKIYRIRTDVEWADVVQSYHEERKYLNDRSNVEGFTTKPIGHWTVKNMRLFMEEFAKNRKMSPLLPETWYNTPREEVLQTKGGSVVLGKFNGYLRALEALFPDIGLDRKKFKAALGHMNNIESRKHFFENYAKVRGFDPHKPKNWYRQPLTRILSSKGALGIISHYNNSLTKALLDLFPNIGLDEKKLIKGSKNELDTGSTEMSASAKRIHKIAQSALPAMRDNSQGSAQKRRSSDSEYSNPVPPGHWQDSANRRRYMDWLATKLGYTKFEHWYQINLHAFHAHGGTGLLLHSFRNSPSAAVVETFVEHRWERFLFRVVPHGFWDDPSNRSEYTRWLGRKLGFSNFDDWYRIDNASFVANHGAGLLKKFGNSPRAVVMDVFREHVWERAKFVRKINLIFSPHRTQK